MAGYRFGLILQYFYSFTAVMKENKGSLNNVRVLKKNMIFLQSYDEIIPTQILKNSSTFATCGKVETVKTKQNYKNTTSYVTYAQKEQAAVALIALYHLSSRLRVLFGTVQYCKYFMRKAECRNETCVFLHARDKKNQIIVNDQIDEDVYDDHYDMALKIAEEDNFNSIKKMITDTNIDDNNIIKKGLKRACEDLNLFEEPDPSGTPTPPKLTQLSLQQTQESELVESRSQGIQKKEQQLIKEQKLNNNFSAQDYIKIRLIKKLIRENNSKIHVDEGINEQHIHNRSKMILYRIVRY